MTMTVKIGINGFGRIGRNIFRLALENERVDVVAINDLTDTEMLAHLLKYDSIHGKLQEDIAVQNGKLVVNEKEIQMFQEHDPENIDWKSSGVDIVIEATGRFTNRKDTEKHLAGGAKKVIITAPATDIDFTVVIGVNDE